MTEQTIAWSFTAIIFIFDLLVTMVKASFSHARLPYLLDLHDGREEIVASTVNVIEKPRLRTGLRLSVIFVHFLFAGLITNLLIVYGSADNLWMNILYLIFIFVGLVVVEFGLEALVLRNPEEFAIRMRFFARVINFIFTPFSTLMMGLLGPNANRVTLTSMTEEDLKNWVEVGQPEGSLDKGEREMIYSIFQFGDTLAKDIMVPRIGVLALDIKNTLGEARATFERAGHSRVPVYQDTVDNVVGLLYAKDLLNIKADDDLIANHRELLRLAYFVPEAKKADELLAEMQSRSMHMAIVVDEYGGVAGVVTLEDIVEEIIGEIRDEYDESEEMAYTRVSDDEVVFLGRVDLELFNEIMGSDIETVNADTIGGFIYGEIGDVPSGGEIIKASGITLIVDQVVGRQISKVRAKREGMLQQLKDGDNADR